MNLLRDPRLHANGNIADFDDAMELIHNVWVQVHPECVFSEDQPKGGDPEALTLPHIVYDLQLRKHSEHFPTGNKPKTLHVRPDPEQAGQNLTEVSEWFDCTVDFLVYGASRKEAKEWTKNFENFLTGYMPHLRESGIENITFIEESRNTVSTEYRQDLPYRRLRYLVRIQRIQTIRTIRLEDVDVRVVTPDAARKDGIQEVYPGDGEFLDLYNKNIR